MPKIIRTNQKIFCKKTESIAQTSIYGSAKNLNPILSNDVQQIQSLPAYELGLNASIVNGQAPFLEDLDSLFYVGTKQQAYLLESGCAEYLSTQEYHKGSIINQNGVLYACQSDNTIGLSPVGSPLTWNPIFSRIIKRPNFTIGPDTFTNENLSTINEKKIICCYYTEDTTHRMSFNLSVKFNSLIGSPRNLYVKIESCKMPLGDNLQALQSISEHANGSTVSSGAYAIGSSPDSIIRWKTYRTYSATTEYPTLVCISGDVELTEKPNWAS